MINNNFCWIAAWKVTDRCNLRCAYCDPSIMKRAGEAETINRFEALDRIAKYKPRILNISGGEPSLVKELPGLLARAKAVWNPFIRVVHNGTGPQKMAEAFPYIDRLVISVDGPGEVNAATRGISGDAVLERIAALVNSAEPCPEIMINTVVTEKNIDTLKRFAAQIASISPRVGLGLAPVMPPGSPLSVIREEGGYRRFLNVFAEVKSAHGAATHDFDCLLRHKNFRKILCYNQYFSIHFSPRGELFTCGASLGSQLRRTDRAYGKIFKKGGLKKAFTMLARAVNARLGRADFTCRNICGCESWFDMLLLGRDTEYAPIALRGFKGRLSDDDYAELDKFVKENINAEFNINRFRELVDDTD